MREEGREKDKVLMSGNEAMGEAALRVGCKFYAGYPITPQNELTAYMARYMVGKGVFIQSESELAAISMVMGAAASGTRSMTSSSSPGISLKQEGISYMAGCQLPAVIINVMRGGPGLGNINSSQSDYFQSTRGGGHGDYYTPVLAPHTVDEAIRLVMLAFDMADYYRTPVLILADAIIGQMMEPASFPAKSEFDKPRLPKSWALTGAKDREPNVVRSLFIKEGSLTQHNENLKNKWQQIREAEQRYDQYKIEGAQYLIVAYGSQARIAREVVDVLREEGINIGLFRPISLWPYPVTAIQRAAASVDHVFVVEQSMGQMVEDVRLSLPNKKVHFYGKAGGDIPRTKEIMEYVKSEM
ncbi:MAG: 3-methyl-2-oxobutanoate dehydrogenase subunit VorB [Candidatus Omnitrophota bacterium]|nr:3-methyl-2-oxobutanoate dehydrogenase subunit VorB [Candidatus Omnitrophota bacterium]